MRRSAITCFFASLALATLGALIDSRSHPSLVAQPAINSAGIMPVHRDAEIFASIHNSTSRPIRLLGACNYCSPDGCMRTRALPATIPPHSSLRIVVTARAMLPGRFAKSLTVYTDAPDQPTIDLKICGIARS